GYPVYPARRARPGPPEVLDDPQLAALGPHANPRVTDPRQPLGGAVGARVLENLEGEIAVRLGENALDKPLEVRAAVVDGQHDREPRPPAHARPGHAGPTPRVGPAPAARWGIRGRQDGMVPGSRAD